MDKNKEFSFNLELYTILTELFHIEQFDFFLFTD